MVFQMTGNAILKDDSSKICCDRSRRRRWTVLPSRLWRGLGRLETSDYGWLDVCATGGTAWGVLPKSWMAGRVPRAPPQRRQARNGAQERH